MLLGCLAGECFEFEELTKNREKTRINPLCEHIDILFNNEL